MRDARPENYASHITDDMWKAFFGVSSCFYADFIAKISKMSKFSACVDPKDP